MDKILFILRKEFEKLNNTYKSNLFESEICYDVICGLQYIKKEKPKLVIIDMATSRISGMDLVRIIRSNPYNYHMKIAISSRNFNFKYLLETFDSGADFYIKYPFEVEDIERIYSNLKFFDQYIDLETIAQSNDYHWLTEI